MCVCDVQTEPCRFLSFQALSKLHHLTSVSDGSEYRHFKSLMQGVHKSRAPVRPGATFRRIPPYDVSIITMSLFVHTKTRSGRSQRSESVRQYWCLQVIPKFWVLMEHVATYNLREVSRFRQNFWTPALVASCGFGGLVVSMLAFGTRVRGFETGRSRWIFRVSE